MEHTHTMPPAGRIIDALRASQSNMDGIADDLIKPWGCCARGVALLIMANLHLAAQLGQYAGMLVVAKAPENLPADAESRGYVVGYAIAEHALAGETAQAVALMADALERPERAHGVLAVSTQVLAAVLDVPPAS